MQAQGIRPVSGHVFRVERKRGPQWYVKYRLPSGTQVQKRLGPEWPDTGPPAAGYFTKRTAQAALQAILTDARRGTLPGLVETGATVADAAAEWLRYSEQERGVKPSTLSDYQSTVKAYVLPRFGHCSLEEVTTHDVARWQGQLLSAGRISRRTVNKILTALHAIFERARRVWGLASNPVADVARRPERYSGDLDFFSPEEVMALVNAAQSKQDGAIFLTAAYTGLRRGELIALRWRDLLFERESIRVRASYSYGALTTPKSGKVRTVPMVPTVAEALVTLRSRDLFVGDDDLVFPGLAGEHLDGSALRRRYKAALKCAGLRELRFHDLRHVFGSLAINALTILEVKEAMGHADVKTTMRYLHHKSRADEARRLAAAFATKDASGANLVVALSEAL
jgi:integrase